MGKEFRRFGPKHTFLPRRPEQSALGRKTLEKKSQGRPLGSPSQSCRPHRLDGREGVIFPFDRQETESPLSLQSRREKEQAGGAAFPHPSWDYCGLSFSQILLTS